MSRTDTETARNQAVERLLEELKALVSAKMSKDDGFEVMPCAEKLDILGNIYSHGEADISGDSKISVKFDNIIDSSKQDELREKVTQVKAIFLTIRVLVRHENGSRLQSPKSELSFRQNIEKAIKSYVDSLGGSEASLEGLYDFYIAETKKLHVELDEVLKVQITPRTSGASAAGVDVVSETSSDLGSDSSSDDMQAGPVVVVADAATVSATPSIVPTPLWEEGKAPRSSSADDSPRTTTGRSSGLRDASARLKEITASVQAYKNEMERINSVAARLEYEKKLIEQEKEGIEKLADAEKKFAQEQHAQSKARLKSEIADLKAQLTPRLLEPSTKKDSPAEKIKQLHGAVTARIESLDNEIKGLKETNQSLESQYSDLQDTLESAVGAFTTKSREYNDLLIEFKNLNDFKHRLYGNIDNLQGKVDNLQERYDAAIEALKSANELYQSAMQQLSEERNEKEMLVLSGDESDARHSLSSDEAKERLQLVGLLADENLKIAQLAKEYADEVKSKAEQEILKLKKSKQQADEFAEQLDGERKSANSDVVLAKSAQAAAERKADAAVSRAEQAEAAVVAAKEAVALAQAGSSDDKAAVEVAKKSQSKAEEQAFNANKKAKDAKEDVLVAGKKIDGLESRLKELSGKLEAAEKDAEEAKKSEIKAGREAAAAESKAAKQLVKADERLESVLEELRSAKEEAAQAKAQAKQSHDLKGEAVAAASEMTAAYLDAQKVIKEERNEKDKLEVSSDESDARHSLSSGESKERLQLVGLLADENLKIAQLAKENAEGAKAKAEQEIAKLEDARDQALEHAGLVDEARESANQEASAARRAQQSAEKLLKKAEGKLESANQAVVAAQANQETSEQDKQAARSEAAKALGQVDAAREEVIDANAQRDAAEQARKQAVDAKSDADAKVSSLESILGAVEANLAAAKEAAESARALADSEKQGAADAKEAASRKITELERLSDERAKSSDAARVDAEQRAKAAERDLVTGIEEARREVVSVQEDAGRQILLAKAEAQRQAINSDSDEDTVTERTPRLGNAQAKAPIRESKRITSKPGPKVRLGGEVKEETEKPVPVLDLDYDGQSDADTEVGYSPRLGNAQAKAPIRESKRITSKPGPKVRLGGEVKEEKEKPVPVLDLDYDSQSDADTELGYSPRLGNAQAKAPIRESKRITSKPGPAVRLRGEDKAPVIESNRITAKPARASASAQVEAGKAQANAPIIDKSKRITAKPATASASAQVEAGKAQANAPILENSNRITAKPARASASAQVEAGKAQANAPILENSNRITAKPATASASAQVEAGKAQANAPILENSNRITAKPATASASAQVEAGKAQANAPIIEKSNRITVKPATATASAQVETGKAQANVPITESNRITSKPGPAVRLRGEDKAPSTASGDTPMILFGGAGSSHASSSHSSDGSESDKLSIHAGSSYAGSDNGDDHNISLNPKVRFLTFDFQEYTIEPVKASPEAKTASQAVRVASKAKLSKGDDREQRVVARVSDMFEMARRAATDKNNPKPPVMRISSGGKDLVCCYLALSQIYKEAGLVSDIKINDKAEAKLYKDGEEVELVKHYKELLVNEFYKISETKISAEEITPEIAKQVAEKFMLVNTTGAKTAEDAEQAKQAKQQFFNHYESRHRAHADNIQSGLFDQLHASGKDNPEEYGCIDQLSTNEVMYGNLIAEQELASYSKVTPGNYFARAQEAVSKQKSDAKASAATTVARPVRPVRDATPLGTDTAPTVRTKGVATVDAMRPRGGAPSTKA